jgi:CrcB protein
MKTLLIVAIGGAIGSACRYGAQSWILQLYPTAFPMGTFLVNITGCLLIGLFYALAERGNMLTPEWRLFLITGICGGYTTFSSFALENLNLLRGPDFLNFTLYTVCSVVLGIAAAWLGTRLVKLF